MFAQSSSTRHRPDQDGASPCDPAHAARAFRSPLHIVEHPARGLLLHVPTSTPGQALPHAILPPLWPERLGDRGFLDVHGLRFPYVAGAMANGIATAELVIAMARGGMLGFFGAAGLPPTAVGEALDTLSRTLDPLGLPWGANLIHSPNEPSLEAAVAELYIARGVKRVSASAYMGLTLPLVRYACTGLVEAPSGRVLRRHHVFAKISRAEVARHFMSPAPAPLLDRLVEDGMLTSEEARLARRVPIAEDITVEADSGGHTDNRPLPSLFPTLAELRDGLVRTHGYARPIRLGAAGGLGTPRAVAGAFAMGAAYVVTGSVNQAAIQSGLSQVGREMLANASTTDVVMAPAADMFEQGVQVQVLGHGTLFGKRGGRLYEAFKTYGTLEALPSDVRRRLEEEVLGETFDTIWAQTERFWLERDPAEVQRALDDPHHRLALCCRWYLGKSSRWAITGEPTRRADYQIWCGPAMGAFNAWVRGSFLEDPAERDAVQIALNLLEGACVVTRASQLRSYGIPVPDHAFDFRPRPLD